MASEVEGKVEPATYEEDEREVLFFASYCGDDNPNCSERIPCPDCLGMSNVFRIKGTATYSRTLAPDWFAADVPISDDQMRRIEKRLRVKIAREGKPKRKAAATTLATLQAAILEKDAEIGRLKVEAVYWNGQIDKARDDWRAFRVRAEAAEATVARLQAEPDGDVAKGSR